MAASTAPEAKKRILALIRAWPALSTVQATWIAPTESEGIPQSGEMIYLGPVEGDSEWITLGTTRREEDYTIALGVWTQMQGDDPQPVEERCWQLLSEVAAALTADKYLGGLLDAGRAIEINSVNQNVGVAGTDTLGARIDASIHIVARLTP